MTIQFARARYISRSTGGSAVQSFAALWEAEIRPMLEAQPGCGRLPSSRG